MVLFGVSSCRGISTNWPIDGLADWPSDFTGVLSACGRPRFWLSPLSLCGLSTNCLPLCSDVSGFGLSLSLDSFWKTLTDHNSNEWPCDCWLTQSKQIFSYALYPGKLHFWMRWWWFLLCTRSTRWVDFYTRSAVSLKQQSAVRHVSPLKTHTCIDIILIRINQSLLLLLNACMLSGDVANINFLVFCFSWPGLWFSNQQSSTLKATTTPLM